MFAPRLAGALPALAKARAPVATPFALPREAFKRAYRGTPRSSPSRFGEGGAGAGAGAGSAWTAQPTSGTAFNWKRVGVTAGIVATTVVATNAVLNRETRDALSPFERSHLNSTFRYTGLGLSITAATAYSLHKTGWSARIMMANPWLVLGVGLVGGIGSMIACRSIDPDNTFPKLAMFATFQASQAVALAPLLFLSPALLARAGLYTLGVVGSLAYVGATAKQDKFLYLGGPLLAGVTVVALSSLAPMILPVTALRTLALTEALSLYGGLAVFSAFILYDTQKILARARMGAMGGRKLDPVADSISLTLDTLNIFVRMVQILSSQQRRR